MSKNKIIVLSDIHIGDNTPTVWYQKEFHEPYLTTVLDHIIQNADSIKELILLGDVVDFWTYPPNEKPPTFSQIIDKNPNIFGANGKLSEVLTALEGEVTYVHGNHDMNVTQEDLNQIQNPNYKIKLSSSDIYFPLGEENKKIVCTHGNRYTMFNAPDTNTKFNPLPIGHFVTRSISYELQQHLREGQSADDLERQGAPNGIDLGDLIHSIKEAESDFSIADLLLDYITNVTSISESEPILLSDGQTTTIAEAKQIYSPLWQEWINQYGGGQDGLLVAIKAAIADANGDYLGWFAQKLALECGADLVVMGHTHKTISGLEKALVQYVNSGFNCPSKPDLSKQSPTFVEIDIDNCQASIFKVVNQNNRYKIEPDHPKETSVVIPGLSQDYSCYIIVDNTNGTSELERINYSADKGHYIVEPPAKISPGEVGRFWLQDYPVELNLENLFRGSQGQVSYSSNGQEITLSYKCPVGFWTKNHCSGANFTTSTDGNKWGKLNKITHFGLGHPFFVRFII